MSDKCKDCGKRDPEYYMVYDATWLQAHGEPHTPLDEKTLGHTSIEGQLCLKCLKKRLGRDLLPHDFPPILINLEVLKRLGLSIYRVEFDNRNVPPPLRFPGFDVIAYDEDDAEAEAWTRVGAPPEHSRVTVFEKTFRPDPQGSIKIR